MDQKRSLSSSGNGLQSRMGRHRRRGHPRLSVRGDLLPAKTKGDGKGQAGGRKTGARRDNGDETDESRVEPARSGVD